MESNHRAQLQMSSDVELREQLCFNLARTAAVLGHRLEVGLRRFGLSPTQYNVLRVLRRASQDGLCQYEIGNGLVAQVPDVPRIIDRMEAAGWVKRERSSLDRRVVMATLTDRGRALVDELDGPMSELQQELFPALSEAQLETLNELLLAAGS
jgi:DNA-binding MarR family transcriptional regulator